MPAPSKGVESLTDSAGMEQRTAALVSLLQGIFRSNAPHPRHTRRIESTAVNIFQQDFILTTISLVDGVLSHQTSYPHSSTRQACSNAPLIRVWKSRAHILWAVHVCDTSGVANVAVTKR